MHAPALAVCAVVWLLASPPLGLGPHRSLGGSERCSSDMAINSDGSSDKGGGCSSPGQKGNKKGGVWGLSFKEM